MALARFGGQERLELWDDGGGTSEPIDRAHLQRMTLGDETLQREVLQLFIRQSAMLAGRMEPGRPAVAAALAHTLTGSAMGLGANRLAVAAGKVEAAAKSAPAELEGAIAALREALDETSTAIVALLRAH